MKWRKTEKVPAISPQAFMFRWRKQQRWARLHPGQAAVLAAERLVSAW